MTEGFRSLRLGERIRFLLDPSRPDRASYVIRIDMPDVEDYYQEADSNNVEDLPALRVPIIDLCCSGSMPVFVEGAAEPVWSADIEVRDRLRIGNGFG